MNTCNDLITKSLLKKKKSSVCTSLNCIKTAYWLYITFVKSNFIFLKRVKSIFLFDFNNIMLYRIMII